MLYENAIVPDKILSMMFVRYNLWYIMSINVPN